MLQYFYVKSFRATLMRIGVILITAIYIFFATTQVFGQGATDDGVLPVRNSATPGDRVVATIEVDNEEVNVYRSPNDPPGYEYGVKKKSGLGFGDDHDYGPTKVDPRDYERWRVIGDVGMYGDAYDYKNKPCTGAPGEDTNKCNNSCVVLDFWSCDTRPHDKENKVDVIVDGDVYDTIMPTEARPGYLNFTWSNQSKYDYTPDCGDSPENMYKFKYPTPVAWKDGKTRVIQLRAKVAQPAINKEYYRSNDHISSYLALTTSQLLLYGVSNSSNVKYYFMYTDSKAPTSVTLPNAGWDEANHDGDSNDITSFPITCPSLPGTAPDLTGQLLSIQDQVVNDPYDVTGTVRNVGDAGTGANIPVRLQFDYGRNGFTNGSGNDFTVNDTMGSLTKGATANTVFNNVTHVKTGAWQVRMIVDPESAIETNVTSRANNATGWQAFNVTVAPGTPTLDMHADTPVTIGQDFSVSWDSQNVKNGSCVASGAWAGGKDEIGYEIVKATAVGTMMFTLSCTGNDNKPIAKTATVQVVGTTADLLFSNVVVDTCTPAEQADNGSCPHTAVTLTIKNQGVAISATEAIPYRLYRNVRGSESDTSDDKNDGWIQIKGGSVTTGLGAGKSVTVAALDVTNLPAGEPKHRFLARVNQPNTNVDIGETKFSNNATTTPYFLLVPPPPDYRVPSFSVTDTCPDTGIQNQTSGACPTTKVTMTIVNRGADTPAGAGEIRYGIERYDGTWKRVVSDTTKALAADASRVIADTVPNLPVGKNQRLRVVVNPDDDDDLAEQNTSNNTSPEDTVTVLPLPTQCENGKDDNDPEDKLADAEDPACWTNPKVPSSYDKSRTSEADTLPVPEITITADPWLVRYDKPAQIRYSIQVSYLVSCVLQGPGIDDDMLPDYTNVGVPLTGGPFTTTPLRGTQPFTITCTPDPTTGIGTITSKTINVEVVPKVQEI